MDGARADEGILKKSVNEEVSGKKTIQARRKVRDKRMKQIEWQTKKNRDTRERERLREARPYLQ